MLRVVCLGLAITMAATLCGQTPTPTTTRSLIDSLTPADVQKAIDVLKSNYINPDALSDAQVDRAKLEGLLTRLGRGAVLVATSESNAPAAPFYSDLLGGHIAYLRIGEISRANLDAFDAAVKNFGQKKVDAVVVDLRASASSSDFGTAAEFAKRFCAKGKTLFTLHRVTGHQDRTFTSDGEPALAGLLVVLADGDTSGAAEALAATLRANAKALVVGAPTAGRAVEYSDFKLTNGTVLRVAIAEAVLPGGARIFPEGVKPDIPAEMPASDKREVFQQSREKGMTTFVFEAERPHMNEAALMSGRNPELEAAESRRTRGAEKSTLHDPVVQRALDIITSIGVYRSR